MCKILYNIGLMNIEYMTRIKIKESIVKNWMKMIPYGLVFFLGFFIGRNYPDIMNQFVRQLEDYTELITLIATVALVSVTIYLAGFNKKMWLAQDKPWLHFYFREEEFEIKSLINATEDLLWPRLYIRNVGKGHALDVKFNVDFLNKKFEYKSIGTTIEIPVTEFKISSLRSAGEKLQISGINYTDINKIDIKKAATENIPIPETTYKL